MDIFEILDEETAVARKKQDNNEDYQLSEANRIIFGNKAFRPYQLEIIRSVMSGEDAFVIMPTGGGKSLCYALPAILSKGVTIVISPLISLIEDQVSAFIQLPSGGIPTAYLTSTCSESMEKAIFKDLERGKLGLEPFLKLLYLTPERIAKAEKTRDMLIQLYQNEMLARFVIDEAHCVSHWGHDFRKDYTKLDRLKLDYPDTPIIALTATARKKVADDTTNILRIPNCRKFNTGFDRPNLFFEVTDKSSFDILTYIDQRFPNETGIVYCMTKAECEVMADYLRDKGIEAAYYHAGQPKLERKAVQSAWLQGKIKVVCATIAYGMGIDMPHVRFVIHLSLAKSLEGYYQEAGRAGRDGQYSECIILYHHTDVGRLQRLITNDKFRKAAENAIDMLEEVQDYCLDRGSCRRKIFYQKFTEQASGFQRCNKMCDNCKCLNGVARRSFGTKVATDFEPAGKRYGSSSSANSTVTMSYTPLNFKTVDSLSGVNKQPARFQPASRILQSASIIKAEDQATKPKFSTASGKAVNLKSAVASPEKVIDLVDESAFGEDGDDWILPHPKNLKAYQTF